MQDRIFLSDLQVAAVIGIYDWERKLKQTLSLDLEMPADVRGAASTDAIDSTLNYKAVAKRVISFVGDSEFQLVETLAERVAALVRSEFGLPWIKVRVNKPGAIRGARDVGILIERGRVDGQVEAFVSLGSNVEPRRHLRQALAALEETCGPLSRSAIYQNPAVGFDGDDFLNLVVGFETELGPAELTRLLHGIEDATGRDRTGPRFGPRALDLDLLLFGDQHIKRDGVEVPRAEIARHAFVLRPLAELAGYRRCPNTGKPFATLWQEFAAAAGDSAPTMRAVNLEE